MFANDDDDEESTEEEQKHSKKRPQLPPATKTRNEVRLSRLELNEDEKQELIVTITKIKLN